MDLGLLSMSEFHCCINWSRRRCKILLFKRSIPVGIVWLCQTPENSQSHSIFLTNNIHGRRRVVDIWRPIIRLSILPPGHWTCSFVCHFNFTESIQSCSRFGAINLSYTLPSLSYQVAYSFSPESSEAFEGEVPYPRTQHLNNVPRLTGEKQDIYLKILPQTGCRWPSPTHPPWNVDLVHLNKTVAASTSTSTRAEFSA